MATALSAVVIAGLIAPVAVRSSVPRREAPLTVAAVVVFAVAAYVGLGRAAGVLLALATAGALVLVLRNARAEPGDPLRGEVTAFLDTEASAVRTGREAVRTLLGLIATLGFIPGRGEKLDELTGCALPSRPVRLIRRRPEEWTGRCRTYG
jgi:hypothetical protein